MRHPVGKNLVYITLQNDKKPYGIVKSWQLLRLLFGQWEDSKSFEGLPSWDAGFRVWASGFRVWALGFRVWALGFRVWGLGFAAEV